MDLMGDLIGRFLAIRKSAFSRAAYPFAEEFLSFFLLFHICSLLGEKN